VRRLIAFLVIIAPQQTLFSMKRFLLAAFLLCNVAAFAQSTKGSIGFEAGLPVGQADQV
jgi:hypothetical protein